MKLRLELKSEVLVGLLGLRVWVCSLVRFHFSSPMTFLPLFLLLLRHSSSSLRQLRVQTSSLTNELDRVEELYESLVEDGYELPCSSVAQHGFDLKK